MNKEERALKTIKREELDYLPSYVTFSDRTRMEKVRQSMGFKTGNYGDDLRGRTSPMKSPEMFRKHLMPRINMIRRVFKDAGLEV